MTNKCDLQWTENGIKDTFKYLNTIIVLRYVSNVDEGIKHITC